MLWWAVLLVFGLPLINYIIELVTEKRATSKKLEKIEKRLKELDKRKDETPSGY
jgi:hypothetical protein